MGPRRFFAQDPRADWWCARAVLACSLGLWLGANSPVARASSVEEFRQLLSQGRCEEAQKLFSESASETEASRLDLSRDLAACYAQSGNMRAAESLLDQVLAQQPDHPEALYLKSYVLFNTGRYPEALQVVSKYFTCTVLVAS